MTLCTPIIEFNHLPHSAFPCTASSLLQLILKQQHLESTGPLNPHLDPSGIVGGGTRTPSSSSVFHISDILRMQQALSSLGVSVYAVLAAWNSLPHPQSLVSRSLLAGRIHSSRLLIKTFPDCPHYSGPLLVLPVPLLSPCLTSSPSEVSLGGFQLSYLPAPNS